MTLLYGWSSHNVGSGAMTNSIAEVVDADAVLVIGSNTTKPIL